MTTLKPLKPSTTTHQQLTMLKSRGLIVDDESRALHYLANISYYRLSGYFYPFRQLNKNSQRLDVFITESRFDDVIKLYVFDRELRLLALDALERIEVALRVDIGNTLARRSSNAHEFPQYFDKKYLKEHQAWLEKYAKLVKQNEKQPFVAHHLQNYGTLPIWVACEVLDFGALSKLYQMMRYKDKEYIANKYYTTPHFLTNWLRSLNFIRNVCAHHARLWNVNIVNRSDIYKAFPKDSRLSQLENNKLCAYLLLMQHFLSIISPNSYWKNRCIDLINHSFPKVENKAILLNDLGYFNGFDEILLNWQINQAKESP